MQTTANDTQRQPLVSFIVTAYNLPVSMLRECLESILALSLRHDEREIILVDDGSDLSVINELSDISEHIIYIRQHNQGPSAARNTGLRLATGRYMQFVDGDDFLLCVPYEHCLDIVRYHDPDMVMFVSSNKREATAPLTLGTPVSGSQFMRTNNIRAAVWSYIFKRPILGDLRFPVGIDRHEDEEFTPLLLLRAERVYPTEAEAYYYRRREASLTNSADSTNIRQGLRDFECVIDHLLARLDTLPVADKPALARRLAQLSMDFIYNTAKLTHDRHAVDDAISRLEKRGLFPLPDKKYTKKYSLFRKCVNSKALRHLFLTAIAR